jgi:hypothetical protein
MKQPSIRVKIIARGQSSESWSCQIPCKQNSWGSCEFIFNIHAKNYDWLVVIDDISRAHFSEPEALACAEAHTLLVTTEPPTITRYGRAFGDQFAHVLTSQSKQALPHKNRIYSHTGNLWFNGHQFDELVENPPTQKSKISSTVCSSKQQRHTIHNDRFEFTQWLLDKIPSMDLFGHGTRYIENKYDALDAYKFHLAIENHIAPHHWTEKLADPYLSNCIPIYYGCPNISDYFPEGSYIPIDIYKPEEALETIQAVLADPDAYTKRYEALQEARNLVLYKYNLIAMLDQFISKHFDPSRESQKKRLYGRKQMRLRHPSDLLKHIVWSSRKSLS